MLIKQLQELDAELEGDLFTDEATRLLFSSDASIYQQQPLAVAYPKTDTDCIRILQFTNAHNIAVIARAAGTSLAGQVVGPHLVVDTSRYLTNIFHIDHDRQTARIQPGVVPAQLNAQLRAHNLMFAPDPSTFNRCTIGGMIGNNAWGAHCPRDGTTREHIAAITAILSNGEVLQCHDLESAQLTDKQALETTEGRIYRSVIDAITRQRDVIVRQYPDPAIVPCNAGYALHILARMQPWQNTAIPFNLVTLLCGSEGTLAFTTEATVKLTPVPRHTLMLCPHFDSLTQALNAVKLAKSYKPAAIELLDQYLLRLTRYNLQQQRQSDWIHDDPAAILLIEFSGDDRDQLTDSAAQLCKSLQKENLSLQIPVLHGTDSTRAWSVRRASLGLLMGVTGKRKPVTFIEDSAVPVSALSDFVSQVQQIMTSRETECVYYGSVSMGLIHLRPLLDLTDPADIKLLKIIAHEVASLIKQYHGTLSAKHGDGIVRGQFIHELLGDEISTLIGEIKHVFDPKGLLNPGKIVQPQPMDQHLRLTTSPISQPDTFFQWDHDGGFFHTVEKCNGAGACRKGSGTGTMCPSYMATHNEMDSTRGRANIFRQVMQQYSFEQAMAHPALNKTLDNCLSCKACQSECPANVDMAKMKAEFLFQRLKRTGKTQRQLLVQHLESITRFAARWPSISNRLQSTGILKSLFGIAAQRQLPRFARHSLSQWFKQNTETGGAAANSTNTDVVLLCDPFTQYYDVEAGIAAVEFLHHINCRVILTPCFGSLRGLISQGLLAQAQRCLQDMIAWLSPHAEHALPIIGIEPSEILTLRNEALDFPLASSERTKMQTIAQHSVLFDEFIAQQVDKIRAMALPWRSNKQKVYVHGHCHQKSLSGIEPLLTTLSLVPQLETTEIPSGCCGMAGLFGYEAEHYDLSIQIAELELFPALRLAAPDALIVATGTSCRQQIAHGLQRQAVHTAQVLRTALAH